MDTTRFDRIASTFAQTHNRRGAFRFLAAAALGAGGLAALRSDESQARQRGKAEHRGPVAAQGKKGAKITICYQNQTRRVKKQGWSKKYPGATPGACPEPGPCTSWILSGGPNPTTRIEVDDDLWIYHRAALGEQTLLIGDNNGKASSLAAVSFMAQVGEELSFLAKDVNPACCSLSPLWLHCATTGQKRMLYAGNSDGCATGRSPSYFASDSYVISV